MYTNIVVITRQEHPVFMMVLVINSMKIIIEGVTMIKDINKKIGKRISELRKEAGLSQAQLAEGIGLSSEYISRLERGINAPSVLSIIGAAYLLI